MNLNALVPWRNTKPDLPAKREDFFDPFHSFRREVDRMFDRFFEGLPMRSGETWQGIAPAVDINETAKEMVVTAELPGVTDKDIEVTLAGDLLTSKARRKMKGRMTMASPPMSNVAMDRSHGRYGCLSNSKTSRLTRGSRTAC